MEDCDILRHERGGYGAMAILPIHGTRIEDVVFDNIRVEWIRVNLFHFEMRENLYSPPIYGDWKWPGSVSNVTIRNVRVARQAGGPRSLFAGFSADKPIRNVTIQGLRYGNTLIRDAKGMGITMNPHVFDARFLDGPAKSVVAYEKPDAKAGPFWLVFSSGFNKGAA